MKNIKSLQRIGKTQQKIISLLLGGLAIGLSGSPRTALRVIKEIGREWEWIYRRALDQAIERLYRSNLVEAYECPDGKVTLVLSDSGKQRALLYNIETMQLKRPARWDGYWRAVLFDIPEKRRAARDAFLAHLTDL